MGCICDKKRIAGTRFDRRSKLTEEQKACIKLDREYDGTSYQKLAKKYKVSKRTIIFVCKPETYKKCREQFKQRRKDGRYKVSTSERTAITREHRAYKNSLIKKNLI